MAGRVLEDEDRRLHSNHSWEPTKYWNSQCTEPPSLYYVSTEYTKAQMRASLLQGGARQEEADWVCYPRRGEIMLIYPSIPPETYGWKIGMYHRQMRWINPHVITRVPPIFTTVVACKYRPEGCPHDIDARDLGYADVTREILNHAGSCVQHAEHRLQNPRVWEVLTDMVHWRLMNPTNTAHNPCRVMCDHGKHRSRLMARLGAAWSGGAYTGPRREYYEGCPGCHAWMSDECYGLQLSAKLHQDAPRY